jgi:uncharacterized OB-fold protein
MGMSVGGKPYVREIEMEINAYHYTPGPIGLKWLEELKKGSILAALCDRCGLKYIPPKIYCPRCFSEVTRLVEISGKPYLAGFTIVYRDFDGNQLEEPIIVGLIKFEGVEGGLIHYIRAQPERVSIGMKLEPVFKSERRGSITDIEYFRPA